MSDTSRMIEGSPPPVRVVRITWMSAFAAVAAVGGFMLIRSAFVSASRVLSWAVAAAVAAVFVEPFTTWLSRFIPRVLAVLVTIGFIGTAVAAVIIGSVDDLDSEVARLQAAMPAAIAELEARDDEVGRIATEINLSERAETFLDAVDERVGSASKAVVDNASALPVYFVSAILTVFLLVYGPRIATGALRQLPARYNQELIQDVVTHAVHAARRTLTALIAQGLVAGGAVYVLARVFDLPAPAVLALIATVVGTLPDVGLALGIIPTAALLAALESVTAAAIVILVVLGLQLLEALYVRRWVRSVGVDVGPAVIWIVGLVGYSVYGPGMAFYAIVIAIFALAIIDQVPAARARLET